MKEAVQLDADTLKREIIGRCLNARDHDSRSALEIALENNALEVVRLLLEQKDIDLGWTRDSLKP